MSLVSYWHASTSGCTWLVCMADILIRDCTLHSIRDCTFETAQCAHCPRMLACRYSRCWYNCHPHGENTTSCRNDGVARLYRPNGAVVSLSPGRERPIQTMFSEEGPTKSRSKPVFRKFKSSIVIWKSILFLPLNVRIYDPSPHPPPLCSSSDLNSHNFPQTMRKNAISICIYRSSTIFRRGFGGRRFVRKKYIFIFLVFNLSWIFN